MIQVPAIGLSFLELHEHVRHLLVLEVQIDDLPN